MAEKEWSENPEDDPIELQKQQLAISKKFMAKLEAEEAEKKAQRAAHEAAVKAGPCHAPVYTPPAFEEVSAVLKKAWDEVERIMPTAGDRVKAAAFQTLMQAAAPPFGSSYVTG